MKKIAVLVICVIVSVVTFGQENPFEKISFIIGDWTGTISDFEKSTSKIESSFQFVKDGEQIKVSNQWLWYGSLFDIKYDAIRQIITCDRVIMCDPDFKKLYSIKLFLDNSLSTDTSFVFMSEQIENSSESNENPAIDKVRWTIKKVSENEYKDLLEISYPGKDFKCHRSSSLIRKQ